MILDEGREGLPGKRRVQFEGTLERKGSGRLTLTSGILFFAIDLVRHAGDKRKGPLLRTRLTVPLRNLVI